MEETRKPVHSFRYGNVECAIWANNSTVGFFFNTTFARVYKDGDQWGQSASLEDRDLPHLMKAAADAHSWIYGHKQKAAANGKEEDLLPA